MNSFSFLCLAHFRLTSIPHWLIHVAFYRAIKSGSMQGENYFTVMSTAGCVNKMEKNRMCKNRVLIKILSAAMLPLFSTLCVLQELPSNQP